MMVTTKTILYNGIEKGWRGFVWMLKIIVPVSFFVLLLQYSGWLDSLDFILAPVMQVIGLPPVAALPLLVGLLTGIYGGIAAMIVLPLTQGQMTLIAIFLLISHSLIQEGVIQGLSGISPVKATVYRLLGSIVTVTAVSFFMPVESGPGNAAAAAVTAATTLTVLLKQWCAATALLALKILVIIVTIMVLLEAMKAFDIIDRLVRLLDPVLKILGLNRNVGMLWLSAAIFGIAYCGALIVEETRHGHYSREELERLHLSIGINHAMIEDPLLFLPLGIGAFWLWVPRLVAAVAAVQSYRLFMRFKSAHAVPVTKGGSDVHP